MSRDFLNLDEVAAWLGKDRRTVEKLVQRGLLPGRRIAGEWRFHPAEVTHWAEQDLRTLDAVELASLENSQKSPELDQQSPLKTLLHSETCETQLDASTKPAALQSLVEVAGRTWQIWDPAAVLNAVRDRDAVREARGDGEKVVRPGDSVPHGAQVRRAGQGRQIAPGLDCRAHRGRDAPITGGPSMDPLRHPTLPEGISARMVEGINGMTMHLLEAGEPGRPVLLLLHGFPELAYSWRRVMVPLAEAGLPTEAIPGNHEVKPYREVDHPDAFARLGLTVVALLGQWDALVSVVDVAPRCAVRCRDPDDQMFIDLAVAHRAQLLSKDALVLRLAKRLLPLGVVVGPELGISHKIG
jgi:PTS system nitrogen regulatory IIA component